MKTTSALQELARSYEQYIIACRRTVHRFAELGGQEVKTAAFIEAEIRKRGLPVERVSTTGLLATLDTGRAGNCVALRADMDALPIAENPRNMKRERTVMSENRGACHACGHDAHVAMLLGAMQVLCDLREELTGQIYFCFEEGEEVGTGWDGMLTALERRKVNTAFALHTSSAVEHGQIAIVDGPCMGGTINVDATFSGRGGHGSRPDLSVNPVYAAAMALCNLSTAFVNQIDVSETVTLGITSIIGGGIPNVIADTAQVLGTMRYFNDDEGKKALRIFKKVFRNTADMNRCKVDFHPKMDILLSPTINDRDATQLARRAFKAYLPEGCVISSDKWYGSETFSHYLLRYKGFYGFLGTKNESLGTTAEHHNEHFDIDESALFIGALGYAAFAATAVKDEAAVSWGLTQVEDLSIVDDEEDDGAAPMGKRQEASGQGLGARYDLDTKIGTLLKSQAAQRAISSVVDGLLNHPQIGFAKGLSIRKAAEFLPDMLSGEVLAQIEKALAEIEK